VILVAVALLAVWIGARLLELREVPPSHPSIGVFLGILDCGTLTVAAAVP
jgi:hypothetical protein